MAIQTSLPQDPDAFCRARECAQHLGIGLSTWWAWVASGKAARPIRLGSKTSVWRAGYVRDLQQKLIAEAQGKEG